jgi:hypothetical protein
MHSNLPPADNVVRLCDYGRRTRSNHCAMCGLKPDAARRYNLWRAIRVGWFVLAAGYVAALVLLAGIVVVILIIPIASLGFAIGPLNSLVESARNGRSCRCQSAPGRELSRENVQLAQLVPFDRTGLKRRRMGSAASPVRDEA